MSISDYPSLIVIVSHERKGNDLKLTQDQFIVYDPTASKPALLYDLPLSEPRLLRLAVPDLYLSSYSCNNVVYVQGQRGYTSGVMRLVLVPGCQFPLHLCTS